VNDETRLIALLLGALIGIGFIVVFMIRSRGVNREDPLQRRLAAHLETYARSAQDAEAFARLKTDLKTELNARSVTQDQWSFRVTSASGLIDPALSRRHFDALLDAVTRLKWNS
jgi:hypothetical protein